MINQLLTVRELFYSLQGEGARCGEPSVFIRLAHCNKNCWFCDTDWSWGEPRPIHDILEEIDQYRPFCNWIIWTGGEPTIQLTEHIVKVFRLAGWKQAIETNGTNPVPDGIDFISCSPKTGYQNLQQNFPNGVSEFRYVIQANDEVPDVSRLPKAQHYYLSPIFEGEEQKRFEYKPENVSRCIELVKENPPWKLSLQTHKITGIR